jgi:hypothetical protein
MKKIVILIMIVAIVVAEQVSPDKNVYVTIAIVVFVWHDATKCKTPSKNQEKEDEDVQ